MGIDVNWSWVVQKIATLYGFLQSTMDILTDALTAADLLGANASVNVEAALGISFFNRLNNTNNVNDSIIIFSSINAINNSTIDSNSIITINDSTIDFSFINTINDSTIASSSINAINNSTIDLSSINAVKDSVIDFSSLATITDSIIDFDSNNFHPIWGMSTIVIIFLPGLIVSISDAIDKWEKDRELELHSCGCFLFFFGFGVPKSISFPILLIWYQFAALIGATASNSQSKIFWYVGLEGHIESGPQAILQMFIILNGNTITLFQIGCVVVSIISVGKCVGSYDMVPEERARIEDNPLKLNEKGFRLIISTPVYMLSFLTRGGMLVVVAAFFRYVALVPVIIQFLAIFFLSTRKGLSEKNSFLTAVTNILVHGNPIDNNPFEISANRFRSTSHTFRLLTSIISLLNYGSWLFISTICIKKQIFPFGDESKRMLTKDLNQVHFGDRIAVDPFFLCGIFIGGHLVHLLLLFCTKTILPKSYQETKNVLVASADNRNTLMRNRQTTL